MFDTDNLEINGTTSTTSTKLIRRLPVARRVCSQHHHRDQSFGLIISPGDAYAHATA